MPIEARAAQAIHDKQLRRLYQAAREAAAIGIPVRSIEETCAWAIRDADPTARPEHQQLIGSR